MTRDTDVSNLWPDEQPSKPEGNSQNSGLSPRAKKPVSKPNPNNLQNLGNSNIQDSKSSKGLKSEQKKKLTNIKNKAELSKQNKLLNFITSWQFLLATGVTVFGGLGVLSVALLFKLPAVPNCPEIFWPTASASLRLYCAQLAANKQTAENLVEAINLVNSLSSDHPLRPEIDRHIEEWSLDILKLGDEAFQAGQLNEARDLARKIPNNLPAYKLVEERIQKWESMWAQAEELTQKVEEQLRKSNWNEAFRYALKLAYLNNNYWSTTRYDEVVELIHLAKEESRKLDKAYELKRTNQIDNLVAAIKLAQVINPKSYAYKEAQDLISECNEKLLMMARDRLDKGEWRVVLEIVQKTPENPNLQEPLQDLSDLANAQSRAEEGTATSLEEAIALAQKLEIGRPLYDKSQELIRGWQLEVEGVARMQRARDLARPGSINDLSAAIAEAQQIPSINPRYREAQTQINRWVNQIQIIEDQPYLERAEQIASMGDISSLQAAISQASLVGRGRALYDDAQGKIRQWSRRIQRTQDQPIIDQADGLAISGNLNDAIRAAQQISPERALYSEAQGKIRSWQREILGQQRLNEAYEIAKVETPQALQAAINLAKRVPRSTSVSSNAREAVNRWSYQILAMAQLKADTNVPEAIAIAQTIPSNTDAYQAAQAQIQAWQRLLQPPEPTVIQTFPTE